VGFSIGRWGGKNFILYPAAFASCAGSRLRNRLQHKVVHQLAQALRSELVS